MKFIDLFFNETNKTIKNIDKKKILQAIKLLRKLRTKNGRLFIIGVGGSAGNASHAVNDFRKLCDIQAFTPVDNISEITAKTNDEGFETIFDSYLKLSNINNKDILLVFSVGGGNLKKKVSVNLIRAIKLAKKNKSKVISIIGKKNGYAYKNSDITIHINISDNKFLTPISETFQALIWHLMVSHPQLQKNKTKW